MNAVIIGHLVLDEIHTLDGSVYESLGGIAFPLFAFSSVTRNGDTITPVFPIGYDAVEQFHREFAFSKYLSPKGLKQVEQPNTRVRLYHESLASYNTRLVASLDSIQFDHIQPSLAHADLVYINMMTGKDIVPGTISKIRTETEALVYLDLHMIAYGVHHGGDRYLNTVPNWKDWVQAVDILQCNERECAAFVPGFESEQERIHALFETSNIGVILITKGEQGSDLYFRDGGTYHVDAVIPEKIVDPTGCGDVFGSVFAYIYTLENDAKYAAHVAAHAASYVAGIPGSIGITGLRKHLETIQ